MAGKKSNAMAAKYPRANALVGSVLNKYHNGSERAVDSFVIRTLKEHEPRLLGIQCFLDQGPAENSRRIKDESHVAQHTPCASGVFGVLSVCGGLFGPGAIMRQWDACSGTEGEPDDRESAMTEYVATVDKILPGWDEAVPNHPVASPDRFWEDDAAAAQCPLCSVVFSEEEQKLRSLAVDAGCDVQALDEAIQKQHGGSLIGSAPMEIPIPPAAHRFASAHTSVEASNQLALAHRQLTMSFKMAQCRAHKVLDKMDATIAALQGALIAQRAPSNKSPPSGHSEDNGWRDNRTRTFVADLAEAVQALLDASSGSDTEDSDANEAPVSMSRPSWEKPAQTDPPTSVPSVPSSMELEKAYELIRSQCETGPASEWDEQIRLDVTRTFGISARRQHRKSVDPKSRTVCNSAGIAIPVEKRRSALENVLRACASVDTDVGYCQGMDHVAALVLAVSDWNEARAFWFLVSLLASPRFELERLYGPGLPHLSLRCFQLDRLLGIHLRPLCEHFHTIDFPISIVATGWFMTLFTNMEALSYDVVVQVFEGFIFKGWKQLFQTALAILQDLQGPILASSFDEIPRLFYDIQEYAVQKALRFLIDIARNDTGTVVKTLGTTRRRFPACAFIVDWGVQPVLAHPQQ
ncbi:uncharacterized protein PITG_04634 [Phytophthora infestans T30-4]|uniref:Rab-GAP TBC domain-containing protein n=1 Tax=Phytophthora infestans (strain T30-4) TaxID=403677 RepID=D0N1P0_PHYIT|nr:uncharacterized protein PITG_04634 [Phytophthora infestans T30-4]EEY68219.1 conserved hypothetical protein [Phytophthora infestans T30-4]|eukprot:XP_002905378.1 conserved hypothetical protein [Phytophthora infestans T30-4]